MSSTELKPIETKSTAGPVLPMVSAERYGVAALGLFAGLAPALGMFSVVRYSRVVLLGSIVFMVCILPRMKVQPRVSWRAIGALLVPITYYVGYYLLYPPLMAAPSEVGTMVIVTCGGVLPWVVLSEVLLRGVPTRKPTVITLILAAFVASALTIKLIYTTYNLLQYSLPVFLVSYVLFANTDEWEDFFMYFIYGSACVAIMGIWHYAANVLAESLNHGVWVPLTQVRAARGLGTVPSMLVDGHSFASNLLVSIALTLGKMGIAKDGRERSLLIPVLVIQLLSVTLTQVRIALIALLVMSFLGRSVIRSALPRMGKRHIALLWVGLASLCCGVAYARYTSGGGVDLARLELWKFGWAQFVKHPLFGVGFGNVTALWRAHAIGNPATGQYAGLGDLHSQYVQILAAGGVAGVLMAGAFLVITLRKLYSACRYMPERMACLVYAFLLGFIGTAVVSLADTPWKQWKMPIVFTALLGLFLGSAYRGWLARNSHVGAGTPEESDVAGEGVDTQERTRPC